MTDSKSAANTAVSTSMTHSPYDEGIDFNLPARLSKVTEENSNHNNSSKDQDDEYEQELDYEEYEQDMDGEAAAAPECTNDNVSSLALHPLSGLKVHQQLYQHSRHNNTPQTTDDDQRVNTPYSSSSPPNEMIPDRVRSLLDRFAANGYILSNAPPPLSKAVIDGIPELIVDKKFVDSHCHADEHDMECPICKIKMETQQSIKVLPCGHYFHSRCIITWLNIHASCPLCRRRIDVYHNNNSSGNSNTSNNNNTNVPQTVQISDAMVTEDAQTRSQMNRLQELRRRRRSRRTLRSYNHSNSASGSHTPHSNSNMPQSRRHNNGNAGSSGNIQHAATQLINAVCEVLDQYAVQQQQQPPQQQQSPSIDDNDQKIVRFSDVRSIDNGGGARHMYMRRKMVSSPGPPPPHSSRSNTQTRNSLSHISFQSDGTLSPLATHKKNYSSPTQKMPVSEKQNPSEEPQQNLNNTIQSILCSPKTTALRQCSNSDEEQKIACLESDADKEKEVSSPNEPITAAKIKQDFAKWMRRRSRLDSGRPLARQTSMKATEETDDMKHADIGMCSASTSRTNSFHHCAIPNESTNGRHTIIYNSNQNFIYNNNYNPSDATPSPSTHATKNVSDNLANFALSPLSPFSGPNSPYVPLQLPRMNTMIVKDDEEYGEDGEDEECEVFCDGVYDDVASQLPGTEHTPTPLHSTPTTNVDIYAMMSDEQLDVAVNRHKSIVSKHQYIIEQIQAEKSRRVLNSCW
eukprot:CAMPEP_0202705944 /NCGR_PEP_ID=MMETSP1385-20130828/18444_1 /ASSEMBLY_ACC=CAM_ASM_000861 /TAXON_ID=933848 /ORGANISM="Elphidium margaritaceum" /LENGTH=742 /DNA_ID=CAMNT_0049364307 /DNA_START=42 /DNA_END=2267 /DNA_ORIENTATION=-